MNTKVMAFGGLAALVLLVGVALFAAAGGAGGDGPIGDELVDKMFRTGSEKGQGEMERDMDGECDPDGPLKEQTQEQKQDGSCGEDAQGEAAQEQKQSAKNQYCREPHANPSPIKYNPIPARISYWHEFTDVNTREADSIRIPPFAFGRIVRDTSR